MAAPLPRQSQGVLKRILSSASASTHLPTDPESQHTSSTLAPKPKHLSVMASNPEDLVPAADKLLIFRTLTGIDTVPVVSYSGHTTRTAANIGIYTRVVRHERAAKKMYRAVKLLASLCLGLQILFGAAVTALGAAGGSYNGITGLGACSTVTASIVAYIKGSGQPDKFKYAETRWRMVREYIEQRERELCLADCGLDVYHEVVTVEEMYQTVQDELADKGPNQQNGATTSATASGAGVAKSDSISQRVNSLRGGAMKQMDEWKQHRGAGIDERMNLGTTAGGFVDKLGNMRDPAGRDVDGRANNFAATAGGFVDKLGNMRDTTGRDVDGRVNSFGTTAGGFVDKLGNMRDTTSRDVDGRVHSFGATAGGLMDKFGSMKDNTSRGLEERVGAASGTASGTAAGIGQHLSAVAANLREKAEDVGSAGQDLLQRSVHQPETAGEAGCRCEKGCRCGEKGTTMGDKS